MHEVIRNAVKRLDRNLNINYYLWDLDKKTIIFDVAFFLNNQPDALIIQIYSVIKLYVFQESSLHIIRSSLLYIRQW